MLNIKAPYDKYDIESNIFNEILLSKNGLYPKLMLEIFMQL